MCLVTRHRGFVRIALEQRASLVPVLGFGELDTLRNAFEAPQMQKATYKAIGFPIPYLMVGKWGWLPLPDPGQKAGLKFVVGKPIPPPKHLVDDLGRKPDADDIEKQRTLFYQAVVDIWNRHAPTFPAYHDVDLALLDER
ncbi:hypothetical protein H632_c4649p0 [Helicosporidium sp. ATCC 50920]|nr:hypothetical protein H632_c4649p0 [Helicosporidium sp. ATCC 50920]|eukprot:KDD71636.1 hypothetical protein H632_c4649p0 [Helicosporidium sp. ATCC 50920]